MQSHGRMGFVVWATVAVIVLVTSRVTQGARVADRRTESFTPSACFEDLCVSRDWYCSTSEQRCKLCQPAHCTDRSRTPAECLPMCSDLLAATEAAIPESSQTATAGPSERAPQGAAGTTPLSGAGPLSGLHLPLSMEMVLIVALCAIVLVVLVLVAVVLGYIRSIHKRQAAYLCNAPPKERMSVEETTHPLLPADSGVGLGNPSHSSGGHSQSSGDSSNSSSTGLNEEPVASRERPHDPITLPTKPPTSAMPAESGPSGQDRILTSNGGGYYSRGLSSSANGLLPPAAPEDGCESGHHSCSFPVTVPSNTIPSPSRPQPETRGLAETAGSREYAHSLPVSPVVGASLHTTPNCHQRLNGRLYSPLSSYDDQDETSLKISI